MGFGSGCIWFGGICVGCWDLRQLFVKSISIGMSMDTGADTEF